MSMMDIALQVKQRQQREQSVLSPSRTIITSFTPRKPPSLNNGEVAMGDEEQGDWVLCLTAESGSGSDSSRGRTLACALSNGQVQVYDQERLHLITSHSMHSTTLSMPTLGWGRVRGEGKLSVHIPIQLPIRRATPFSSGRGKGSPPRRGVDPPHRELP